MFFDRLGNAVTGEEQPIIEEPVVESYYDQNRPVRPGFEKPEMFQESWFEPEFNNADTEEYVEENIEEDIVEYSEMDLDGMSDYIQEYVITEANEESKKARKNAQEFMRNEYGSSHPTSMTSKQRNRMKKWLKDNDYDPKTKTIKTDIIDKKTGKNFRVNLGTNEIGNEPIPMPFAITPQMAHESGEKKMKKLTHDGRSYINMPKSYMKRHPSISTGISKHEEGHVADLQYKRQMAGEKLANAAIEYGNKHGLLGDMHSNPAEYKADIYSATHNKYKDKLRVFKALASKDIEIQRLAKKRIENGIMKIDKMYGDREYEQSVPDYLRIVISSKEDIVEKCQNIIDTSQEMVKMFNEMLSNGSLEGFSSEQVKDVKRGLITVKTQLRDAQDLLKKVENVSFEQAKSISKQHEIGAMLKTCKTANEQIGELIDAESKLRELVVKTFLNEFATEYDMSTVDVIQEMYQTAFEDYVFQEDFEDEEPFDYDVYLEAKIDAAERNELDDDDFGLVYTDENDEEIRKYPLTDKIHIQKAVQFFGSCPDDYKPLLAHNILKKAKKFNIDSSNWDRINKANEKYSDED